MNQPVVNDYFQSPPSTHQSCRGRGNNILVGEGVKEKLGDLVDEVRREFFRWPQKEFTGVVESFSGNKRFLVRFQDGCEKYMTPNQLSTMTVDRIPMTK